MAECAIGVLGPAIEVMKLVAKPMIRQFNYLCCFTSNINSLKVEARKLEDALAGLEGEVKLARDNVQEPVPEVMTWLTNSNNIKVEINGILNEAKNVESGCLKLVARFSLSKKAKKTIDRTKELRDEKKFEVKFQQGSPVARQAVLLRDIYEFESRKQIEEGIMTTLRGGDVNIIGICGMGGLGKTIMAKKLMNRVLKEHVFEEVVMAVVSQNVDKSKILDEIGGSLGLKLQEENSLSARIQKLHARLSGTKRILLVLDDVWQRLVLEDFGIPYNSKGCTILLTSRNSDTLSAIGCKVENNFGMKILSEEEAWFLFREGAGTCVDDKKVNSIAKKVARECRGLPIALRSVSAVLKDENDVSIWEDALRQLSHSHPDIPELITEVYNPLKLSYDFLGPGQAQTMFLLLCLFREDVNIPLEYLTYFCMGLGILKRIGNLGEAYNKIRALTKRLKSFSLLLDSDSRDHVRMHDVVRDVCIYIAKQQGCIGGNDCTWISSFGLDGGRSEFPLKSGFPKLRLLFLSRNNDLLEKEFKIDNAFLEEIRELYVLCIQNYSLTTLPHPTQSLKNLNTLILDSCEEIKTISTVGQLVNLEILICRDCGSIEELPLEIKGLNRLRLLELTGCYQLQSIGRGIISSLVGLEELKMLWSFCGWEAGDREERRNAGLRELEALTNLTCLEIEIDDHALAAENMQLSSKVKKFHIIIPAGSDLEFIATSEFVFHLYDKKMGLRLESETCMGNWIEMQLLKGIECLHLRGNGANHVDFAKTREIRWLKLGECESMKNIVATSMVGDDATLFPSIEYLSLFSLPKLQEIYDGTISSTSFQNLKRLKLRDLASLKQLWKCSSRDNYVPPLFTNLSSIYIMNCPRLRNLGLLSVVGKDSLLHLQLLHISHCEVMDQVFLLNDGSINNSQSHITKMFLELKEVELGFLPNLATFYQGIDGLEFPVLMKLIIHECPKMTSIRNSSRGADIYDHDYSHLFCQPQKVSFGNLKELAIDGNPFCCHEIPSYIFEGLEVLTIAKYHGRMCVFTSSIARNLVTLKKLSIGKCDEMEQVIKDKEDEKELSCGEKALVFPKLEELNLFDLPKLVTFCELKCDVELPSLARVNIRWCPNLKIFTSGSLTAPNLEFIGDATDLNGELQ